MKGVKVLKKTGKNGVYCSGGMGGSEYCEFEVGKIYEVEGLPKLCENGFHFFRLHDYCFGFDYYNVGEKNTVYVEIESLGDIVSDTQKCSTNKIKIIKLIEKNDFKLGDQNSGSWNSGNRNSGSYNSGNRNSSNCNSGSYNSGGWNSGDRNSGDRNSGDCNSGVQNSGVQNSGNRNSGNRNSGNRNSGSWNSGSWNSGNRNSGSWNSCNYQAGFFNTEIKKIDVFNKECSLLKWRDAEKPSFIYFNLEEGKTYKNCFLESFKVAKKSNGWELELKLLENLPNFNWKIFEEISGISKEMAYEKGE